MSILQVAIINAAHIRVKILKNQLWYQSYTERDVTFQALRLIL